jgi:hypothetical protein
MRLGSREKSGKSAKIGRAFRVPARIRPIAAAGCHPNG